jgi:hypothetical protein
MRMPLPRLRLKLCESVLGATAFPLRARCAPKSVV